MVDRFLELHLEQTSNPADLGLLLLLLAEGGRDEQLLSQVVGRISATLESRPTGAFTIQELGWMLWGSSVAARLGAPKAEELRTASSRSWTSASSTPSRSSRATT